MATNRSLAGLTLLLFAAAPGLTTAQVEHGGAPPSSRRPLAREVPTARLRPVDVALLLAEDEARPKGALRFADVQDVELGLSNAGAWEELGDGGRVWRLRIHSPGAKSLALVFSRYALPPGAELFVHDDARAELRGAYTELENRLDGRFALRPLRGDALTLEYFEPASARGRGALVVGAVAHDYRGVLDLISDRTGSGGGSGACEIDVACPLGAAWQPQIDATVHVMALPGGLLCSGSLLNNTTNDGTLLVLSAAHCGSLDSAVFTFQFERPLCGSGVAPTTNTLVGSTQLVLDADTDVQLVRIAAPQAPQPFPVFLAGWDRGDVAPTSSVIVHHPAGDVKKISRDDDPPAQFEGFWRILDWEQGVTEGGSSGAPMFDPAGRFVGNLDSGASSCQVPTADDFATRLAHAWPLLEPYLDPRGTGQLVLDGLDLATVSPQPFDVAAVVPLDVPALVPGVLRTVRVVGTGFTDAATVTIDSNPLDAWRFVRGGHAFLNLDLPQLAVGAHLVTVEQSGLAETLPFAIVPPALPLLQVNEGIFNEPVFSFAGVDTIHSDAPGHIHYCYWSLSGVPSVHPMLSLALGNNFTELLTCRVGTIPPAGFRVVHHPITFGVLPPGVRVYTQSACVSHGRPFPASNLQVTEFQF